MFALLFAEVFAGAATEHGLGPSSQRAVVFIGAKPIDDFGHRHHDLLACVQLGQAGVFQNAKC
jgi:hypothetical protein